MPVNIRMENERPGKPYNELKNRTRDLREIAQRDGIPLDRHHVIPWMMLRDFWNKLLVTNTSSDKYDLVKPFLSEIADNIDRYRTRYVPAAIQSVKNAATNIGNGTLNGFAPADFDWFCEVYAWLPGNLFEGPRQNLRQDDPAEKFEADAGTIVGKPFESLRIAYVNMEDYVKNGHDNTAQIVISTLTSLAECAKIIPLNADQWMRGRADPQGRVYCIKQTEPSTQQKQAMKQRVAAAIGQNQPDSASVNAANTKTEQLEHGITTRMGNFIKGERPRS